MSAFDPLQTLGGTPNQRRYIIGKLPSSSITADGVGSEPAFARRCSRIHEWAQINAVVAFKPFDQFNTVPARDAMLSAYELIGTIWDAAARLLANKLENVV